ncbi:MAG: bifunctional DNA primase/polymerase [Streptomycetales bacterium]
MLGRRRRSALLTSALYYGEERRWDVVPGAHTVGSRRSLACSCARPDCQRPGEHPWDPYWYVQASFDPATIRWWWTRNPQASIVLPTGRGFDALDVPEYPGRRALARLERIGVPLGPVVVTPDQRMLFFVVPGGREELPSLLDQLGWAASELDLRCHGDGDYLVAPALEPESRDLRRWERAPSDDNRRLPETHLLISSIAYACRPSARIPAQLSRRL